MLVLLTARGSRPRRRQPVPSGESPRGCPWRSSRLAARLLLRGSDSSTWLPSPCRIEKKRTIVPTLAEAVEGRGAREVDWEYFYGLLFTSENLKLVHIACHKKTTHRLSCDPGRIYKRPARPRGKRAARKRP